MNTETREPGPLKELLRSGAQDALMPLTESEHSKLKPMTRDQRRARARVKRRAERLDRKAQQRARPELRPYLASRQLREVPRELWQWQEGPLPERMLLSSEFMVQVQHSETSGLRLTVSRTARTESGSDWMEGITWDELQRLKCEAGYRDHWCVECYPPSDQVVNVANMRHLWILGHTPPYGWKRDRPGTRSDPSA